MHERHQIGADESIIGDSDHAASGVAAGLAEGVELLEIDGSGGEAGLFGELASSSFVDTLSLIRAVAHAHESTRERPPIGEGGGGTADQQDFEIAVDHGEHDDV